MIIGCVRSESKGRAVNLSRSTSTSTSTSSSSHLHLLLPPSSSSFLFFLLLCRVLFHPSALVLLEVSGCVLYAVVSR